MSLRFERKMDEQDAMQMNPLQLAYLGDAVWELIVRFDLVMCRYNVRHMHRECIDLVNAHSQAQILLSLYEILTDNETEIVRRGRNSHAKHPAPRNQNPDEYAASTGFEALFGFLYLTGKVERIREIVNHIREVNNLVRIEETQG